MSSSADHELAQKGNQVTQSTRMLIGVRHHKWRRSRAKFIQTLKAIRRLQELLPKVPQTLQTSFRADPHWVHALAATSAWLAEPW